jgi:uncharacterized protein YecT (DUF1311 family)
MDKQLHQTLSKFQYCGLYCFRFYSYFFFPARHSQWARAGSSMLRKNHMNRSVLKKVVATTIVFTGIAGVSGLVQAASFDCAKAATNIEKMICADEGLSALDSQLATVYKRSIYAAIDKGAFKQEQLSWLKTRNACKDVACLSQSYQSRIATLGASLGGSPVTETPKKFITFTLLEGEGYPLCKEYVEMLNKTQYTEIPACGPTILPEYKNFKEVNWVEIKDKQLIKKILEERSAVLMALNPTHSKQMYNPDNAIKRVYENKSKMFSHEIMLDGDDLIDSIYVVKTYGNSNRNRRYGHCEISKDYYFSDSALSIDSINKIDPYRSFNINGSNEMFIYGDRLYVSIYSGREYFKVNFEVYAVGNRKMCGILAK